MNTLEHETFVSLLLFVERQHTLGAIDIGSLRLQKGSHEAVEEDRVQVAIDGEAHRRDQRQIVHLLLLFLRGFVLVTYTSHK